VWAVDRQFVKINPAETAKLRIRVGKQPTLQKRVVGEIDPSTTCIIRSERGIVRSSRPADTSIGFYLYSSSSEGPRPPDFKVFWLSDTAIRFRHQQLSSLQNVLATFNRSCSLARFNAWNARFGFRDVCTNSSTVAARNAQRASADISHY
jgi:hypothetical protein